MTDKTPSTRQLEPGEPLRLFVRGFLRDHLGFSKIMAHHAADLFMERWGKHGPDTMARYQREDVHTLEAKFNRKSIVEADEKTGATKGEKAELQKLLHTRPAQPAVADIGGFDRRPKERVLFDGPIAELPTELKKLLDGLGVDVHHRQHHNIDDPSALFRAAARQTTR